MKNNPLHLNFIAVTVLIIVAITTRLVPHPANFAPMMAISIFGGALFYKKFWAILIPLISIWISDLLINNIMYGTYYESFQWFYEGFVWQYLVYLLTSVISILLFTGKITSLKIASISIGSALIFFIVSNFGVWISGTLYPKTLNGLITCYMMGLPFSKATLSSNLLYTFVLFGVYYLIDQKSFLISVKDQFHWSWK